MRTYICENWYEKETKPGCSFIKAATGILSDDRLIVLNCQLKCLLLQNFSCGSVRVANDVDSLLRSRQLPAKKIE